LLAGSEFGVSSIGNGELGTSAGLWGGIASALDSGIAGLLQTAQTAV